MLSALIISLAAGCAFALEINAPRKYVVGQPINISWAKIPDVKSVTIELDWGSNPSQFWSIRTVPNTGSAYFTPDLTMSAQQLRILNGTAEAYWGLRPNMTMSNSTYNGTYTTNYTCMVTQPMVFTSSPLASTQTVDIGATAGVESRTINATVSILADILSRLEVEPRLTARFASLSSDGKMLTNATKLTVTVNKNTNSARRRRLVSKQLLGAVGETSAVAADGEYTPYKVSVEVPLNTTVGGPYLLVLSLDNARDNGSYVVSLPLTDMNNSDVKFDAKNMFLAYDGRDLSVGFSHCSDMYDNATLPLNLTRWERNEDVCMVVDTGANLASTPVYVAVDTLKDKWAVGCSPRNASSYTKFGWKLQDEHDFVNFTSLKHSSVRMYWAPTTDSFGTFADDMFEMVATGANGFPDVEMNGTNGSVLLDAVKVTVGTQQGSTGLDLEIEKEYEFEFETSYAAGEALTVSFQQCEGSEGSKCSTVGTPKTFAYKFQQKKKMTVPAELDTSDKFKTKLIVSTPACGGKTMLTTSFNVAKLEPKPSSSSSSLSAGEIVGIVCAGVLVCGLAAWWLCMRKSGDDRYTKIDD